MKNWIERLSENKYKIYVLAFLMMVIPPLPMFYAAQQGAIVLIWILLGVIVLANILVFLIP
jgi:hypothetical protein